MHFLSETELLSEHPAENRRCPFEAVPASASASTQSAGCASYRNLLTGALPSLDALPPAEKRMVEMLTFRLLQSEARQEDCGWDTGLKRLKQSASARSEASGTPAARYSIASSSTRTKNRLWMTALSSSTANICVTKCWLGSGSLKLVGVAPHANGSFLA